MRWLATVYSNDGYKQVDQFDITLRSVLDIMHEFIPESESVQFSSCCCFGFVPDPVDSTSCVWPVWAISLLG